MLLNSKSKEGCPCRICKIYHAQVGFMTRKEIYDHIKKLGFSEIKSYVTTIIIVYKCSVISD